MNQLTNKNKIDTNFTEKVDVAACHWILTHDDDDLEDLIWGEDGEDLDDDWALPESAYKLKAYLNVVRKYCKLGIKHNGTIPVKYKFAKGKTSGRLFASAGIQGIKANIRALLCRNYYNDVDMKVAHPTILKHLASIEGIECPRLTEYTQDRQRILEENQISKTHINKMINTDNLTSYRTTAFLTELTDELDTIRNVLFEKNKNNVKTDNKKNHKSSVVNHLLCCQENHIVQLATQSFPKKSVGALMFDGFLLDKSAAVDTQVLDKMTEAYGIQWALKEHCDSLHVPEDFVPVDYNILKEEFEKNNCMIKQPCCFLHETRKDGELLHCLLENEVNFKLINAPAWNPEHKFTFSKWVSDKNRRVYDKIDFVPYSGQEDTSPKNVYNSFCKFGASYIQKEDRVDISDFTDHIKTNMCNGDGDAATWMMNLLSFKFQFPNILPEVAVILKGRQGAGKDYTIDVLERIMGIDNDYIHRTSEMKELYGEFNGALKNKLIVQINELEGKDGVAYKEKLKDLITRDRNTINEKNISPYKLTNFTLLFICSNNLTPIQIPYDDRRYVMLKTGNTNIGNRVYWTKQHANKNNPVWINSLYSHLLDMDLTGWIPDDLSKQPLTECYLEAKQSNISPVYKFFKEVNWDDPELFAVPTNNKHKGKHISQSGVLLDKLNGWISSHNYNEIGRNTINRLIANLSGAKCGEQIKVGGVGRKYYVFDREIYMEELTKCVFKGFEEEEDEEEETTFEPRCLL
jgi:hypothetical protein